MLVRTSAFYTPELLRANPGFLFVFGDNLQRMGKGGQAIIRDEPNAFGLATKRAPNNDELSFFDDIQSTTLHWFKQAIELVREMATRNMVVIPFTTRIELGTGLSQLPERAPNLYAMLEEAFANLPIAHLKIPTTRPVTKHCTHCNSEAVVLDAWASWEVSNQDWVLDNTFDYAYCQHCEGDTSINDRPITS